MGTNKARIAARLWAFLPIYLSIYLSVYLSICLSIHLSIYLSIRHVRAHLPLGRGWPRLEAALRIHWRWRGVLWPEAELADASWAAVFHTALGTRHSPARARPR